ncbi:hypothetical protein O6H91_01G112400 [Diphasiastrum complanatum]|uniref:Uncharacterized protein n=1 Tax=Diphasiastrum complanatum TaxID=34168 RepID=A0ACC2EUS7_DIPCM|nr:hypothetical protein O6H91_01G112400 [Diphasiastrum complanatum]
MYTTMTSARESISQLLQFAMMPIAKVMVMCSLGVVMATQRVNILSDSVRKELSKLLFSLLLPCLIFSQLGSAVTLGKIISWWFIPVNVVISASLGCLLGLLVALIVRPPRQFFKLTIVMVGIGNIGNIPLVLISAVCRDKNNPFGAPQQCDTNGVAYISYGQWVGAIIAYTFVFQMLSPPAEKPNELDNNSDSFQVKVVKSWLEKSRLQTILQPPVAASILSLVVGAIPPLKKLFFKDKAIFFFVSDALNIMGGAMIPCIMLILGGSLVKGPGASELGTRTTVAITLARLLLIPPIGIGVVIMAEKLGLLPPDDNMFRFVVLLQHSMPSSILAGAVASLRGHCEKEASAILFWQHIFAIPSIAGWLVLYFKFLF